MGDFNIDFFNKKENDYKLIKEFTKQVELKSSIDTHTCFSNTKNSCLDQIPTNSKYISYAGTNFFADIGPHLANNIVGNWSYEGIESQVKLQDIIV